MKSDKTQEESKGFAERSEQVCASLCFCASGAIFWAREESPTPVTSSKLKAKGNRAFAEPLSELRVGARPLVAPLEAAQAAVSLAPKGARGSFLYTKVPEYHRSRTFYCCRKDQVSSLGQHRFSLGNEHL